MQYNTTLGEISVIARHLSIALDCWLSPTNVVGACSDVDARRSASKLVDVSLSDPLTKTKIFARLAHRNCHRISVRPDLSQRVCRLLILSFTSQNSALRITSNQHNIFNFITIVLKFLITNYRQLDFESNLFSSVAPVGFNSQRFVRHSHIIRARKCSILIHRTAEINCTENIKIKQCFQVRNQ